MTKANRYQNNLLRLMRDDDFALLAPAFTLVDLAKGEELALPETRIKHSWFPLSGIMSIVTATESGTQAEVGIIGREGMCSVATLHGIDQETMHIFCQMSGQALRIPSPTLRAAMTASPALAAHLLAYSHNFMLQIASSALAYATQTIEARLARWLLMSLDRLDANEITMTHESLALMLGVRRAGVTVAIQGLEGRGAVVARRAVLRVIDRGILAELAGDAYGTAERAYQRVFGLPVTGGAANGGDGVFA